MEAAREWHPQRPRRPWSESPPRSAVIVKQKPLVSAVSAVVVVAAAEDYDYFDGAVVAAVMGEKKSIF